MVDAAELGEYGRTCDWCGYGIPDRTRIVLGNRRFCSRECADAYVEGVERQQKKDVYQMASV